MTRKPRIAFLTALVAGALLVAPAAQADAIPPRGPAIPALAAEPAFD